MTDRLRQFAHFWYDFVVGDDWRLAAGAAVALGATALAHHAGITSWWIAPVVVASLLILLVVRSVPRDS
jgi:hypothetical protein